MSDKAKVEPAKAEKNDEVSELRAKLDNLSAYVRKVVKSFEKLSGIDLNADGKVGVILISLLLGAGLVYAADTQVSGYTNETNVGTFYVSTDGTDSTLTVDKLVAIDAATLPVAGLTGNIAQARITNALATAGATIGGNIPVAAITNAAGSVGASIGGNIPVAAVTNALNQTASAVTNVVITADAKTNTIIIVPVGQVNVIRSWVVTQ
jgi:hypothetical protein